MVDLGVLVKSPSEDARGANLWLVMPNDAGVFHKADSSPKLHDPDVMQFFAAGLDAAGTSKRSYFGRVELR